MAKVKRNFKFDVGGSSKIKGSADTTIEFTPEIDKKPKKIKGTCDTCKHNRYHLSTSEDKKGFCEIGNVLRGHNRVPSENTCGHWEAQKK